MNINDSWSSTGSKNWMILESMLVWGILLGWLWASHLLPALSSWQQELWTRPFLTAFVGFILMPLAVLGVSGRNPGDYGIRLYQLSRSLETGLTALIVLGPASGIAFPLLIALGLSPTSGPGGLILAGFYLAVLPLVVFVVRKTRPVSERAGSNSQLLGFLILLVVAMILAALARPLNGLVSKLIYTLFFVGFGEELFFRGYIQSQLNHALGTPYQWGGASFGWGLVGAALLFGLAHILSPLNPFQWGWGLWTFALGLVFGYLREKSGSFIAPAVAHGIIISVPLIFSGG